MRIQSNWTTRKNRKQNGNLARALAVAACVATWGVGACSDSSSTADTPGSGTSGSGGSVAGSGGAAAGSGGSGGSASLAGSGGSAAAAGSSVGGSAGSSGSAGTGAASGSGGSGGDSGSGGSGAAGGSAGAGGSGGSGGMLGPAAACFADDYVNTPGLGPDYDQFMPVIGSHCVGTNHQDIANVERVVFLGDSVTVGTPPTPVEFFYRSVLADKLTARFGLQPPSIFWKGLDIGKGTAGQRFSGDFASCAKWGARADDLLRDSTQIADCFPEAERSKRTLVVMTMGGNDIASITKDGIDGVPIPTIWDSVREFVDLMRSAITWFKEDPTKFPNGVDIVFANMFEFTDGTGDVTACPAAGLAGFGAPWDDPQALADMVIWANEQFLKIAVDTGTDMVFMLENFCGHGFNSGNVNAPCYRGPNTENWFDLTCIHPTPTGHVNLAQMFESVINE